MGDDQQFCLRWNNHQSTLIQNFDTLLESGTLVDCTLAAEGKYLKAHKVVLSACSPYFEGLLSEHYDKHPVFILKDVKFKELKAMMDYMYRGEVNISQDQLTALLKAAESLQIKGLSDNRTGGAGSATTGKADTRPAKTVSSTAVASSSSSVDIPHASSGLTIEKNSKVPRQSLQQVSVSDLPEDSASPQLRGLSSREGSQSPTRRRKRLRRRSLGNDDTNSMENHEASNSSDVNVAPALAVAPVADEKAHADPADSIGRSALMQQLTKPADEMLQIPIEKPEPSEEMIQPKSEYMDDQESVEDLTNLDDDMNDLNEMEQDNSRAGPSHDPSQHPGIASWHIAGDRSNASVVGAAVGPPGTQDEVFLAAHEAAQAQRDSQVINLRIKTMVLQVAVKSEDENSDDESINLHLSDDSDGDEQHDRHSSESGANSIALDSTNGSSSSAGDGKRRRRGRPPGTRKCAEINVRAEKQPYFTRSSSLTDVRSKFSPMGSEESPSRWDKRIVYGCERCDKEYKTLTRFLRHVSRPCVAKFNCEHCPYSTRQKYPRLARHIQRKHSGAHGPRNVCEHCDERFQYFSGLLRHLRKSPACRGGRQELPADEMRA